MRNRVPEEATCAICGRYFDPSETQGWCPNPSCGQWQHPFFPVDGDQETTTQDADVEPETPTTEPTKTCPSCGNEVRLNENFCPHCAHAFTGDEGTQQEPTPTRQGATDDEGGDAGGLACPDCGADLSGIPRERLSRCPICMLELAPDFIESAGTTKADTEGITECPNCGEDLTPIPRDMRTVCPGCRIDLDRGLEASSESPASSQQEPPSPASETPSPADEARAATIDTVDAIEPGFEHRLEEAGVNTVGDLVEADPDALSTKTGISARRIGNWIEAARDDVDDSTPEPTAVVDDSEFEETSIQRPPTECVFEVMGREISVADGQTVGSEIRSAMVDAGASKEDAVYVHRKHVRVEAEDDEFYLTRLGENSLELNGTPVDRGRRITIEDGDELTFSDVVTVTVSIR